MATPTTLPATFVAGNVLTAAQQNALRGAFRVLQVVNATYATTGSTTSSSYADTGLTATITPSATTNKILVVCNLTIYNNAASTGCALKLLRGSTTVVNTTGYGFATGGSQSADPMIMVLDSPATTSATTYKLQFAREGGAGTVFSFPNGNQGQITLLEISA